MHTDTLTYTTLPSFESAMPLGAGDEAFLRDVRDVLLKHGNLTRFGLTLLHEHFPVTSDEVLLETHDKDERVLTMRVVKKDELDGIDAKATSWSIGADGNAVIRTKCAMDKCK